MGDDNDKNDQSTNITGDVHGDFMMAGRDIHKHESKETTVMGDEIDIKVGNISGSTGVAIGKDIQQTINTSAPETQALLREVLAKIEELNLDEDEHEDAVKNVTRITTGAPDADPDEKKLTRWLDTLEDVAPPALEMLVNGLLAGPGAVASTAAKAIIQRWKADRTQ